MARDRETSRIRYGICLNDEDGCEMSKAIDRKKGKPVQQVRGSKPFVCEKCGEELKEVPAPKGTNLKLIGGIAAIVVCCGGGIYFALSGTGKEASVTYPGIDTTSVTKPEPVEEPFTAVMVESMVFMEKDMNLASGEEKQLNIDCTPGNATEEVAWSSSDESVATVNSSGVVTGVSGGEATLTAKAKDSGVTASIVAKVKDTVVTPPGSTVTKDLGYAVWTGKMKNGKFHDVQGTLKFKTSHVIDARDEKGRMAGPGDVVIGTFEDGRLTNGKWYKKDGNIESLILGGI